MLTITNITSNYLASVVQLSGVRRHSNADKLQCVRIFGNNVITGLTAKDGDFYVYFPAQSAINREYLSWSNSFDDPMLNADQRVKGYFGKNGKVRPIKLRGEQSCGYIIPVVDLENWLASKGIKVNLAEHVGEDFDTIKGILLCEKAQVRTPQVARPIKKQQRDRRWNRVVAENFYFHDSTPHLGRNIHLLEPDHNIAILVKYHGTSAHTRKILCRRRLKWHERLLEKIFKFKIDTKYYDVIYGSREVIKNRFEDTKSSGGFYKVDLWGHATEKVKDCLREGLTIFYEVVGYLPDSDKMIQKHYDYGCNPGEYKIFVYRMTYTSPGGDVYEMTWPQIKAFCRDNGLEHVRELYYGPAKDLFPDLDPQQHWNKEFLARLSDKYLERQCDLCKNDVPAEGITLRIDDGRNWRVFKHKSFAFTKKESEQADAGEVDIETEETEKHEE